MVWRYSSDVLVDLLVRPRLVNARTYDFDESYFEWAFLFRQPRRMHFLVMLICTMENGKPRWKLREGKFNPKEWPAEKCVWTEYIGKVMHARRNLESVLDTVEMTMDIDNWDPEWDSSEWAKGRLLHLKRKDQEQDDVNKVCYIWLDAYDIEDHCDRMAKELKRQLDWLSASNAWMQAWELEKLLDDAIDAEYHDAKEYIDTDEHSVVAEYTASNQDTPLRTI
jgi:hypothetical protein